MGKTKKRFFWFIGTLGIFLALFWVFLLLLPKTINLDPIKEKIIAEVSDKTGAELKFQHSDLSFFPRPKIVVHQVGLEIPQNAHGTLKAVGIVLTINPFSARKLGIARLEIEEPDITVFLKMTSHSNKRDKPAFSFSNFDKNILSFLKTRVPETQDLVLNIKNGRLRFSNKQASLPWFTNINGCIEQKQNISHIEINSTSDLWENMAFTGTMDRENFKVMGRIDLTDFKPHGFVKQLMHNNRLGFTAAGMNFKGEFKIDPANGLNINFHSMLASVDVAYKKNHTVVGGIQLNGKVHLHEGKTDLSITEFALDYPSLSMSGNLLVNPDSPKIRVALKGRKIDVNSLRKEILTVTVDEPRLQKVFAIVKGGHVSHLTVNTHGDTLSDLGNPNHLRIEGHMTHGNIFIPKADLDLKNVMGDAVITGRILKGDNLSATLGNTQGFEGKLNLGLAFRNAPFHLDIGLDADLTELPPVLKRFVKHKPFIREIALIRELKGRAKGRLILGESTSKIKTRVEVRDFHLSGKYSRIPFLVAIRGNHFLYYGKTISVKEIAGTLGKSSFSGITGQVGWSRTPDLTLTSGQASIDLDETYPWLASIEYNHLSKSPIEGIGGHMDITGAKVDGPLQNPQDLRYTVFGNVSDLKIYQDRIDGPITIPRGSFQVSENGASQFLTFKDARVTFLDADLELSGYFKSWRSLIQTDIHLQGNLGQASNQWIGDTLHMPSELTLCSPLSISQGALTYKEGSGISFKGKIDIQNGPNISLDVLQAPETFIIKDLYIKDEESQATLNLLSQKKVFNLDYKGRMTPGTFDRLFMEHDKPRGLIEGDFQIRIPLDHPWQSTAEGELKGQDLFIPWDFGIPVEINQFDVAAKTDLVNVKSARLSWGQEVVELNGDVTFSSDKLLLDLDLMTSQFSWEDVKKDFLTRQNPSPANPSNNGRHWPLAGIIKLKAASLTFYPYTWYPFHSNIILNNGNVEVNVIQANLCDMSMPGVIRMNDEDLSIDFKLAAKDQQLASIISCFFNKGKTMSGLFNLEGEVTGQGKRENIDQQIQGTVTLIARDGRIYSDSVLDKVLTYLNVTEGLWGKLPSIGQEGIGYHSITIKGDIQNGSLKVTEGIMDGDAMEIVGIGKIDILNQQLDVVLLLAPLKTVDRIIKTIPIIGRILGGSLFSIPVKATGDLENPKITTLAPSEIGAGMIRMLERIVKLPIDIFRPAPKSESENKSIN